MSEDRNQAPGKARLKLARERGQVAHSPELASAVGGISALAALMAVAPGIGLALVELMRRSITLAGEAQAEDAGAWYGAIAVLLFGRLAVVVGAYALGSTAAHLIQTRGLVTQSRLVPDFTRLWAFRGSRGPALERAGRVAWSALRALVVVGVAAGWMRASWPALEGLSSLKTSQIATATGALAASLTGSLAGTALALGALDYALRGRSLLGRLKTTREQQREEHRQMEGDTAGRGARRRMARSRQATAIDRTTAGNAP